MASVSHKKKVINNDTLKEDEKIINIYNRKDFKEIR